MTKTYKIAFTNKISGDDSIGYLNARNTEELGDMFNTDFQMMKLNAIISVSMVRDN